MNVQTSTKRYGEQFVPASEPAKVMLDLIAKRLEQVSSAYGVRPDEWIVGWSKDGYPAASSRHFVEGQFAALSRLRRLLTSMGAISRPVALIFLQNEITHWEQLIAQLLDDEPIVRSRLAYARGARDAAEAIMGAFVNFSTIYWREPLSLDEWA